LSNNALKKNLFFAEQFYKGKADIFILLVAIVFYFQYYASQRVKMLSHRSCLWSRFLAEKMHTKLQTMWIVPDAVYIVFN